MTDGLRFIIEEERSREVLTTMATASATFPSVSELPFSLCLPTLTSARPLKLMVNTSVAHCTL